MYNFSAHKFIKKRKTQYKYLLIISPAIRTVSKDKIHIHQPQQTNLLTPLFLLEKNNSLGMKGKTEKNKLTRNFIGVPVSIQLLSCGTEIE